MNGIRQQKTVIFGTGRVAEVVYWYLKNDHRYEVVAFSADREYIKTERKFDLPVIAFDKLEEEFPPDRYRLFTGVAYSDSNRIREEKYFEGKDRGYDFISYVNPQAMVADNADIGENSFVFESNVVQPFVTVGDNTILWCGNHIGHHTSIGDHCFVSSHVVISGNVSIGRNCFLGVNATIIDGVDIAEFGVIGADALIVEDTEPYTVYSGEAAEVHSKISRG